MLELIELFGTPHEMGVQHGRRLKEQVRELSRIRLSLAQEFARTHGVAATEQDCRKLAQQHFPYHEQYFPEAMAEWRGIAEGAEMPLEDVFFANALTDFQDVLRRDSGIEVHGCTSFAIAGSETVDGATCIGQTWDMHAGAQSFIAVFHRRPDRGVESLTMTTAGCLTLAGVNSEGVAVGNNNLRPTDARPGVIYLAMLHRALRQASLSAAIAAITEAHRASGHNYLVADADGGRVNIETTAERYDVHTINVPRYVHTNHYLSADLKTLEDPLLERGSTEHRLTRLREQFDSNDVPLSPSSLRKLIADHNGGQELCICRHGTGEETRSCAFVVLDPTNRSLTASLGPPCEGELQEFWL